MQIIATTGNGDLAQVYLADFGGGRVIEMVESIQPPLPRNAKWVLIVSTLFGCPGRCLMCDAGAGYRGKLTAEQILSQIDFLVQRRYPNCVVPVSKFKIQFARMGDPALNPEVLTVLEKLPGRYDASGLLPCLSTIAPCGSENFLDRLADLKQRRYPGGRFQMQFSLHTTDPSVRDRLMPLPKWSFSRIAEYGNGFFSPGDRRIALNFALMQHVPVDPKIVAEYFDPRLFLIKITPMNPTYAAVHHGLSSVSADLLDSGTLALAGELRSLGFEVIVSVGETAEDRIGSNCGQYVTRHLASKAALGTAYTESIQIDTLRPGTDRATPQA